MMGLREPGKGVRIHDPFLASLCDRDPVFKIFPADAISGRRLD
jgi:hypothetical protein